LLDITDRKRHEQRLEAITGEVQHRLKNVLAIIQSLAKQTFKDPSHKRPLDEFLGRLHAFAAATDALRSEQGNAAEVQALVEEALKPFRQSHSAQIEISGPRMAVDAQNALSVSMTLHELSTNAVKYGALSSPSGQVTITWHPSDEQIVFQWREMGGPPVMAPEVTGFGSRLIRGLFPQNSIDVRYPARGVECDFAVPKKTSVLT
jgi:two-component sensor histidine kinase